MLVILLFILLVLLFNANTINKSIILHNTHANSFFASTLLALYLFVAHPYFFFFHQVVWKPLKFINNILQTNGSFLNESDFPNFLPLFIFILGHRLGKCSNNFCININILSHLVRNDTAKIWDMVWKFRWWMQSKSKANRKAEFLLLLFTLLTLDTHVCL